MEEENLKDLGERLQGLREACDVSRHTMAEELGVDIDTYRAWEETGEDIPISAIYHMARKFSVDLTEILTGTAPKLDTYHLVRRGETEEVERFPGYHYEDMASRYARNRCWSSWIRVTSRPSWCATMARSSTTCWKGRSSSPSATATSS